MKAGLPRLALLAALMLCSTLTRGQYVAPYVTLQGTLTTSSGLAAKNATLTFSPSQVFFVAGSSVVVQESQCGTDTNGTVVGVGNPVLGPRATPQFVGTLPVGNYYIEFAWYDQFGIQTLVSPEVTVQLTHTGELQILPPVGGGPPQATGMAVYIGTVSGGETLQGTTASLTAQFTQAAALNTTSAVPQIRNLTACRVIANDAGFPTGTGYNVGLLDASGNTLFAYPEMWQFFGPGSTYNLSQGLPYYHGQVTYPVPILTIPYNHNAQSISSPLSLSGYNLYNLGAVGVGTATPAWGVDVEGTGLDALINAKGGYLVNGAGGTAGQCLGSDGTALDVWVNCITSAATVYYQTDQANGTAVAQQPVNNFLSPLTVTPASGATNIGLQTVGAGSYVPMTSALGTATDCVTWTAAGLGDSGVPCPTVAAMPIIAKTSFNSCVLGDDGTGGSGCQTTQSWGTTISGTYTMWCAVGYLASVACGNLGNCSGVIYNEESHTASDFTYILNQRLNNGRTYTVPMTCWATN
jgi:hypothetical protein